MARACRAPWNNQGVSHRRVSSHLMDVHLMGIHFMHSSHGRVTYRRRGRIPHAYAFRRRVPHRRASYWRIPHWRVPHNDFVTDYKTICVRSTPHANSPSPKLALEIAPPIHPAKKALGKASRSPPPYKWWSICEIRVFAPRDKRSLAHSLPQATHLLLKHCAVTFFQSFLRANHDFLARSSCRGPFVKFRRRCSRRPVPSI
jgi:hypothetical protein